MLQKVKNRLKEQKGFTLIELLAVIVILGILASIAVPAIANVIQNSRVDAVKADAVQVLNSAKLYDAEKSIAIGTSVTVGVLKSAGYLENTSIPDAATVAAVSVGSGIKVLQLTALDSAAKVPYNIVSASLDDLNNDEKWDDDTDDFLDMP